MNQFRVKYKIIADKNLIVEHYSGNLTLAAIKKHKQEFIKKIDLNADYKVIADFRDTVFPIKIEAVEDYVSFLMQNEQVTVRRKTFYITDKPEHVVLFTLLNNSNQNKRINVNIVSTLKKAIEQLCLNSDDYNEVESILKQLKEE